MSLRQQAVRGVFWSSVQNWGSSLLTTAVTLVLARRLGPAAFGQIALASAVTAFLGIFVSQGFGQAIVQRAKLGPGHLDTAFWMNVVGGVVMCGLTLLLAEPLAILLDQETLAPLLRWLSLGFILGGLGATQGAILRRHMDFKSLALRKLLAAAAGSAVGIAMALSGCGVWSLVAQNLVSTAVGTVALWTVSNWRPGSRVSRRHARDLLAFGLHVVGMEVLQVANRRGPILVVGYFLGPVALGYYSVAMGLLTTLFRILTENASTVMLPTLSRLQGNRDQMRHAFHTATRLTSLIAFPAFIGLFGVAPELVHVVLGAKWANSVPVMEILSLAGIAFSVFYFNTPILMAHGKASWAFWLSALNTITSILVPLIVVRWGIVVVAAAFVLRAYLTGPLCLVLVDRLLGLDWRHYLRQYTFPLTGSLVMLAVVLLCKFTLYDRVSLRWLLLLSTGTGALTYVLFVRYAAPHLLREVFEFIRLAIPFGSREKA
jgi:PST family polysaccharide transporter